MIRLAVIGTNWITEEFIHAARETGEFDLTAVYSRTEEKAAEFADEIRYSSSICGFECICAKRCVRCCLYRKSEFPACGVCDSLYEAREACHLREACGIQ